MKKLKIVFFGTPDFAVPSLEAIIAAGHQVVAVVTGVDKPAGRGKHLMQSAVKQAALRHNIPVLQPEKLKDEAFVSKLRELAADLFVVIAFRMLPEVVWTMPPMGTFNLHASLLPRYRGAAPINRAIMNGDTETGVTTFFLKHEIDTGDVIARERIEIDEDDDAGTVHDRLMELGARLTAQTVNDIAAGTVSPVPQNEILNCEPSPAPKIFKDTCHIDWNRPARQVRNHIRGLAPYPAAWTQMEADGQPAGTMKIFAGKVTDIKAEAPGRVHLTADGRMIVDCSDFDLEITSLQPQGKRRMDTADYLRGCRFKSIQFS
ncbi:MAG: methionyl-tRNA formyltransferase [Firmicutes bacterium]|nr:methionyl-tRNA formyltransferase [Bacillota bacterium]MCM1401521.1 methionyl-tRNA formyltransferase [Bacteroides sp.]MCM1477371.1 methionyl-tRNA formyltransferase [Bacteroides sp.]